ncbi:dihydropteroate synthase [Rubrivirga sp. S365]|uniref:Dihydropteroate synthase n=1 Tax=Rubrivirga litoralis TaxID=3075598 RepID=A0ABU3BT29_9BACT|nr:MULTISPECIES: dihydropteroate synthase [unclassified Rubrivirga]MDT0632423.1 dihydropteroate synthase [Rubrivirga sp. F394]MDT7855206.1 dihydropteroate synthase [Rubrivirga sp. S365]
MPAARSAPAPPPRPAPRDGARGALDCRGRTLDARPGAGLVMGVLNVTPDSFSDGGRYATVRAAVDRAAQMADEGAAVVDVGGESTRPGAAPVGADEETARVVPVVEAIAREVPGLLVSVDTTKGAVARAALRAGAHLVNDVAGGADTAEAAAEWGAPLVVMHALGATGGAAPADAYGDVVADVAAALERAAARAEAAGVRDVVVDPGFGFGKSVADNLRLVAGLDRLAAAGRPVLVGVSRKSTVGAVLARAGRGGRGGHPAPVSERLYGSLGLAALAVVRGAAIVRVHDVRATVETLCTLTAALDAGGADAGGADAGGADAGGAGAEGGR